MGKFLKYILALPLIFGARFVQAVNLKDFTTLTSNTASNANYSVDTSSTGYGNLEKILSLIIIYVLSFLGIIFIGLIIYGGIIWMTANGNEQKVSKAEEIIKQSFIGLIIVLIAYGISYFLISIFGGQLTK